MVSGLVPKEEKLKAVKETDREQQEEEEEGEAEEVEEAEKIGDTEGFIEREEEEAGIMIGGYYNIVE